MALDQDVAERFVTWLQNQVIKAARGDEDWNLAGTPAGTFWLGTLASEEAVQELNLGERGERLDPCAIGIRLRPKKQGPWKARAIVSAKAWLKHGSEDWRKSSEARQILNLEIPDQDGVSHEAAEELASQFEHAFEISGFAAEIRVEIGTDPKGQRELTFQLVNITPEHDADLEDTNLYECSLRIEGIDTEPFLLESLPDSFRYDRRIWAYGINCGVTVDDEGFSTNDAPAADQGRPQFWNVESEIPDMDFETLAADPVPTGEQLTKTLAEWGEGWWDEEALKHRAEFEGWSPAMLEEAKKSASEFQEERERLEHGVYLLSQDPDLRRAFKGMNQAMKFMAGSSYTHWRPFQLGFLLANLSSITNPHGEADIADLVWFATGGGKTETYLGLLITAALYDRITGKVTGLTGWSRFPLRMLSLQQTQRFANAMAAAEMVRRKEGIQGDPLSLGYLVGQSSTPNEIKLEPKNERDPHPYDDNMPEEYKILRACPFCGQESLKMKFEVAEWTLEHQCTNPECPWPERGLPFYIVDAEIYRFLPTVVVGTLDKAAAIGFQAAMRGFVGPPLGQCSEPGHGYKYASRGARPNGCLVPGCRGSSVDLSMAPERFGPSFRLQDELHLLKDSLGGVDSHYEALLDGLQQELCGRRPKILASSATLEGYQKQVDVLYKRRARVFPVPGPTASSGFWASEGQNLLRRYLAISPRGATMENAMDRILIETQKAVRRLTEDPVTTCHEIGVDPEQAAALANVYGTNVAYGNTIRDLDAVQRSIETRVQEAGPINTATLTGRTPLREVRQTLEALEEPPQNFEERLHIVTASSMMSHGVDIDRLNTMAMIGLPLGTAEFIQSTARIGRRWPGLIFVLHRMGRERDAGIFRSFEQFVKQGDRFIEPIPITRRSRQVLERTFPGLALARIWAVHEPQSQTPLSTNSKLRTYFHEAEIDQDHEFAAMVQTLAVDDELSEHLRKDLHQWYRQFFRNLEDPEGDMQFPRQLSKNQPMTSLRDVDEQVIVFGRETE